MDNNYLLEKCYALAYNLEIYIAATESSCAIAFQRELHDVITDLEVRNNNDE